MKWFRKHADEDEHLGHHEQDAQTNQQLGRPKTKVELNPQETAAYERAEVELEAQQKAIRQTGSEQIELMKQLFQASLAEKTSSLIGMLKRPGGTSTISQVTSLMSSFEAQRTEIITKKNQDVSNAFATALAEITAANERANAQVEALQSSTVTAIEELFAASAAQLSNETEEKNQITIEMISTLIHEIERSSEDTFTNAVEESASNFQRTAEIYGQRINILFSAMAKNRMRSIRSASGESDFDVSLSAPPTHRPSPITEPPPSKPAAERNDDPAPGPSLAPLKLPEPNKSPN